MENKFIEFLNKVAELAKEHDLAIPSFDYDEFPCDTNGNFDKPSLTIKVQ
ncbi:MULTISPECIES: hypothetical protein [Bacillus cereus group]|nr:MULTISPECIES: hypothetical protein [Bacillus cereus group]MED2996934.1 hypothetical protein [Bacillus tropicus]